MDIKVVNGKNWKNNCYKMKAWCISKFGSSDIFIVSPGAADIEECGII